MDEVGKITGRPHKPFDYVGAPDAEYVIVAMGSGCDVATEAVNKLNEMGEKVGLVSVHLYRPFCTKRFVDAIPATCKRIAVLDRTKESGPGRAALPRRLHRPRRGRPQDRGRRRPLRPGLQGVHADPR